MELKPCPFCGEKPMIHRGRSKTTIGCFNAKCEVNPLVSLKCSELPAKHWNSRPTPQGE